MATNARIASAKQTPSQPSRWWQWILFYPALGISLVTSVPEWADKALAKYNGVKSDKYSDALRQTELWKNNLACLVAPIKYSPNVNNVNVDATICKKTGDNHPKPRIIYRPCGMFPTASASEVFSGYQNFSGIGFIV